MKGLAIIDDQEVGQAVLPRILPGIFVSFFLLPVFRCFALSLFCFELHKPLPLFILSCFDLSLTE